MIWRNLNTGEYSFTRPLRVRRADGMTVTNEDITDDDLIAAGWVHEPYEPQPF